MKRIFTFLMAVAVSTAVMVAGEIVQYGDLYYELIGTDATVIKDQSGASTNYGTLTKAIIPSTVPNGGHDYTVTKIDQYAFRNCTELLAVSIPSTVTYVVNNAFQGCLW